MSGKPTLRHLRSYLTDKRLVISFVFTKPGLMTYSKPMCEERCVCGACLYYIRNASENGLKLPFQGLEHKWGARTLEGFRCLQTVHQTRGQDNKQQVVIGESTSFVVCST